MNEKLERFYRSLLACAGLTVTEEGMILDEDGEPCKTKAGEERCLPYKEHLKSPKGKKPIHPLNEHYLKPDSEDLGWIKTNLTRSMNERVTCIMAYLLGVASDPDRGKEVKSTKLLEFYEDFPECDFQTADFFATKIYPKAIEKFGPAPFIKIFLKLDGSIGDRDYKAISKVTFTLYEDICRALDEKGDYKILDTVKCRKKDLLAYKAAFEHFLPGIEKPEDYMFGTDNKLFRFLNALLLPVYSINTQVNEYAGLLEDDFGATQDSTEAMADLDWADILPDLYDMVKEIEAIPNQDDIRADAIKRLEVSEEKVAGIDRESRKSTRKKEKEEEKRRRYVPEDDDEEEDRDRRRRHHDDDDDDDDDDTQSELDDIVMGRRPRKKTSRRDEEESYGYYDEYGDWIEENPRLIRQKRKKRSRRDREERRRGYSGDRFNNTKRRSRRDRDDDDDGYYDRYGEWVYYDDEDDDEDGYYDKRGRWHYYDDEDDYEDDRRRRRKKRSSRDYDDDRDYDRKKGYFDEEGRWVENGRGSSGKQYFDSDRY